MQNAVPSFAIGSSAAERYKLSAVELATRACRALNWTRSVQWMTLVGGFSTKRPTVLIYQRDRTSEFSASPERLLTLPGSKK